MSKESANQIAIEMDHMISSLPSNPSKPSIFRVDNCLRCDAKDDIYHPQILAIGPYHHRKCSLQNMEQHKYRYLKQLLRHKSEQSVDGYVIAMTKMEKRARECYAGPLDLNEDEFVKMMVLDGCFLIQLFRCCGYRSLRVVDDPIFENETMLRQLRHDIMLIENQLPFFVLNELFNMTKRANVSRSLNTNQRTIYEDWENILSFSKLRDIGITFEKAKAGTTFEKAERTCTLMDINFVKGVLRIPRLNIFDETESQFRNLIAYEQYFARGRTRYVSDHTFFMHCLIRTSKDVTLLRFRGIIGNRPVGGRQRCLRYV